MSWLSKWFHSNSSSKDDLLAQLFLALLDGKITKAELQDILIKVGLGVVSKGLAVQLQRAYDLTDPVKLANLGGKTLDEVLAEVNKAHVLIGTLLKEVE